MRLIWGLAVGLLMGGTGACTWAGGADSYASAGLCLWVRLEAAVCLGGEGSLGNLFTDGWGCNPTWIIVWPGLLSVYRWGQIFPKWPPLEEHKLMNISETFTSNVLPSR